MKNEPIDEILGAEESLVPSSGFLASVMERVREEAATPPPIPFPWKRALPGFVVAVGVFAWGAVEFTRYAVPTFAEIKLTQLQVFRSPCSCDLNRPLEQAMWVVGAWALCRWCRGSHPGAFIGNNNSALGFVPGPEVAQLRQRCGSLAGVDGFGAHHHAFL